MAVVSQSRNAAVRLLSYNKSLGNIRSSVAQLRNYSEFENNEKNDYILTQEGKIIVCFA